MDATYSHPYGRDRNDRSAYHRPLSNQLWRQPHGRRWFSYRYFRQGTPDASTNIDILTATGEVSGTAMLTLTGGDTLTLRNNSATPFMMDIAPGVGAQFDIILLS